jgi:YVTN family beta-propeller protein
MGQGGDFMGLDGRAVAVLHKLEDTLAVFEVSTGREIFRVPTARFPHEMCLSPDRRRLLVSEYGLRGVESEGEGGRTIGIFDVRARARTGEIGLDGYRRPHGIVAHESGRLFVTCERQNTLLVVRLEDGARLHAVDVGQALPHIVAVSPDGATAVTANIGTGTLTAVDVEQGLPRRHVRVLERPEGMAFSPDGRLLYVVNRESDAIAVVETGQFEMVGRIATGRGPVRVAITPDGGRIGFPLFFGDAVQIADTSTLQVVHTTPVGRQPAGTTMSRDGEVLFVSCEMDRRVYVVSVADGQVLTTIGTGEGPDAMASLELDEVA